MAAEPLEPLVRVDLQGALPLVARGKVRDIFEVDAETLLFVATDRISAYDVCMTNGIPQKGRLLTLMSLHWDEVLKDGLGDRLETHVITRALPRAVVERVSAETRARLDGRSVQVRRLQPFPLEAIVRGYLTGSAWKEYQRSGTVHGMTIAGPGGAPLRESEKLERPLFTPSTKAEPGAHDENLHPEQAAKIVGDDNARRIEELSLALYEKAHAYALQRGIIIADVKFEFAKDGPNVVLIDEILTPDSSRFWPAASYEIGRSQQSFDKQSLRDWLTQTGLKGEGDVVMPEDIVRQTSEKYIEAFETLTGKRWEEVVAGPR